MRWFKLLSDWIFLIGMVPVAILAVSVAIVSMVVYFPVWWLSRGIRKGMRR